MNLDSKQRDRSEQNNDRKRRDGGGQPPVVQSIVMLQPGLGHARVYRTDCDSQSRYRLWPLLTASTTNSGVSYGCFATINPRSAGRRAVVVFRINRTSVPISILP